MVNKAKLEQIQQEAIEIHQKTHDTFNAVSRDLLNTDPTNVQLKLRLNDIMKQLDLLTKSKNIILSVKDGKDAELKGIEEEIVYMRRVRNEIIDRLEKAKKLIEK